MSSRSSDSIQSVQSPAESVLDFRKWESCRTMPLGGGFSRVSPVSPTLLHTHLAFPSSALETTVLPGRDHVDAVKLWLCKVWHIALRSVYCRLLARVCHVCWLTQQPTAALREQYEETPSFYLPHPGSESTSWKQTSGMSVTMAPSVAVACLSQLRYDLTLLQISLSSSQVARHAPACYPNMLLIDVLTFLLLLFFKDIGSLCLLECKRRGLAYDLRIVQGWIYMKDAEEYPESRTSAAEASEKLEVSIDMSEWASIPRVHVPVRGEM
ncbi:hypothetical protein PR048_003998 [Dryococelus australis]|uniref:Uncharacterized protein n=1 Tax=Dryococelus australis TaxID=614101 RepID=A0ABQ9I4B0_9NEOP|nr:hypothetical protein PR048_003998 [Dryococelus australis]